jgi:hypothetical protein
MKQIRRSLILLIIIVYSEFFNLFAIKDIYIGPVTIWDIVTIFALFYLIVEFVFGGISYTNLPNKNAIKWVNILIFFILIITLTMPFRGETLFNALLASRKVILSYLMLHLFVIDIIKTDSTKFIEKTLIYSSILFSIVFILKFIFPDFFINQLGFVYVLASFLLLYWNSYFKISKSNNILILILLFIGLFAQPFRAYAFSSIILLLTFTILQREYYKIIKYLIIIIVFIGISIPLTSSFGKLSIENQVNSLIIDFSEDGKKSSTGYRLINDLMFRIPMIEKAPYFGYGYIHPKSDYAKNLGFRKTSDNGVDPYNLYSVDSGYLTFLTTFGFIGTSIIFLIFLKINIMIYKIENIYKYTFIILSIVFLASTYTHNPYLEPFGIIPLMMVLSLFTKDINKRQKL